MTFRPALSRRHLLTLGGVAAAAAPWLGEATAFAKDAPQVPRRTLGKTGQKVPILLLGGGAGFDPKFDPKIARALQHGIDYIDAARVYAGGTCEANAATTLERLQMLDKVWITSKSEAFDAAGFERNVETSLGTLRRKSVRARMSDSGSHFTGPTAPPRMTARDCGSNTGSDAHTAGVPAGSGAVLSATTMPGSGDALLDVTCATGALDASAASGSVAAAAGALALAAAV